MLNLLLTVNDFFTKYGVLIILAVALAFLMFVSFNRRKREEDARARLNDNVKPGSKVKTYGGVYGTIISIEETTDGKIVLLETGEGNKKSYQNIHINAIFGLDDKKPVVLDADGNIVFPQETSLPDLDTLEKERLAKQEAEEVKKPVAKKATTAKKTTTAKTSTAKKTDTVKKTTTKK